METEMERIELLWKERQSFGFQSNDERVFILAEFLDNIEIHSDNVQDLGDFD